MGTSESLRAKATRLFALALDARGKGNTEFANLLTDAAARYLDQATAAEAAEAVTPAATHEPPVTQQQRETKPKKEE